MEWIILKETKKIENFTVQKAKTNFGGRLWEAWFSNEIPLPYGPFKFYGLPGLILEINDSNNEYIFKFVQNRKMDKEYDTSNFLEIFYETNPIKISLNNIEKIKKDYFMDPYREFKLGQKKGNFQNDKGETIQNPNYKELTDIVRTRIIKQNNNVEKNKVIHYPKMK